MLLPHLLNGEKVVLLCIFEMLLALADFPDRSEKHISPLAGTSLRVLKGSFADTVLVGNRYFILLPWDTAAPLTAISAPQPFDSRLTGSIFPSPHRKGVSLLTIVLLFNRSTLLCVSAVARPSCV